MGSPSDRCALNSCGKERCLHYAVDDVGCPHFFVEPIPAPQEGAGILPEAMIEAIAVKWEEACHPDSTTCRIAVVDGIQEACREAYRAGFEAARRLDMNDEALVADIAYEVYSATKTQPHMGGKCRRVHGDEENRRIARAAIRAINLHREHAARAQGKEGT